MRKNSPSIAKGAEWQIIAAYDKLMAEDDARRQKDRQSKAKQDFRRTLDEHVQLSQELKKGGNRDEVEYSDHVNHDIENFRMEEAKKEAELKRRNLELLHIRKEQCEDQERHKRNEQTKSAEFARGMVQNAHEKLAVEKLIQEEARRRVREMRKKIEEDNVQNKKILQEVRIKEREEDQRLMAEYAAKLDKEAFERDHAFNIRMAHIDKSALQFALEGAGKVAQDEQRQREAMLMKELLQAEEREIAEIQRKDREKKLRLQKMLQGNQELIQSREQEKREEMQIRIRLAKQYKEEEDRVRQEEHEARQKRLIEQQKYNDRLHKQIVDRDSAKVQRDEMVGCERALNRAKLEKALANETVIQEVLNGKVANNNQPRSMGPL